MGLFLTVMVKPGDPGRAGEVMNLRGRSDTWDTLSPLEDLQLWQMFLPHQGSV